MKRGILLLNFGGPWTLSDVRPFLYRLFVNPRVLVGIPWPFRQMVALIISLVKGPSSVKCYRSIGGGSPQLKWTTIQAEGLRRFIGRGSRVEVAMRSADPSIETALQRLRFWGAQELVLLPLFPQFSTATTGTCFDEVDFVLKRLPWEPKLFWVKSWPDEPAYIDFLRLSTGEAVSRAMAAGKGPVHIIFSAHSLPLKIVAQGDPYEQEVKRTISALTGGLEHSWSLAYQSRNGKLPWLQPYLEDEIKRLGRAGIENLVVVPISFVSDHIETLYELDQLYSDLAKESGIANYQRARCFNDDPLLTTVLSSLIKNCDRDNAKAITRQTRLVG